MEMGWGWGWGWGWSWSLSWKREEEEKRGVQYVGTWQKRKSDFEAQFHTCSGPQADLQAAQGRNTRGDATQVVA